VGAWLSLVEHLVRDQGVGGSNPLAPTISSAWALARSSAMAGPHNEGASPFALDRPPPAERNLPGSMPLLHVVVRGRGEGVGFRYFVRNRARALGVSGRVWNRSDGAVELEAQGERGALDRLLDELRRGPPRSHVEHIETSLRPDEAGFQGFEIVG